MTHHPFQLDCLLILYHQMGRKTISELRLLSSKHRWPPPQCRNSSTLTLWVVIMNSKHKYATEDPEWMRRRDLNCFPAIGLE
uniref:Uncharacterized protein n=1 Tax=Arundo donax TaxID=35708 RepID=A0A0A9NGC1_ARUDO